MGYYNEADTRAKLIDPKVKLAEWGEGQIEREHYFVKGRAVTNGRIYLVGEESRRRGKCGLTNFDKTRTGFTHTGNDDHSDGFV